MAADLSGAGEVASGLGTGSVVPFGTSATPGEPTLRWAGHATSVAGIERELGRIWSQPLGMAAPEEGAGRIVAARTSVLNLVVVARTPELGEQAAATLALGTGRHPSRTLIVVPTDPDGPAWLRADVKAYCMTPRAEAPETCAEQVYVTAGGDAGRHLQAIVAPLLVHDLPVTVWWPGDPPFGTELTRALVGTADRLVVDGSRWSGDGLGRLRALAALARPSLPISDFAFMRQARWREAVASVFDREEFLPYLRSMRGIAVTYASHGGTGAEEATNLVKPIYHVAWLGSRLRLRVGRPAERVGRAANAGRGLRALLAGARGASVEVALEPVISPRPGGTTLRVELRAERRGSELRAVVTAEAESVHVRVWRDGVEALQRAFHALRRTDADLLAEAIEAGGRDLVAEGTLALAAGLAGPGGGRVTSPAAGARGEPAIVVRNDAASAAAAVAEIVVGALSAGAARRGRADFASTGGSTPAAVYRALLAEPLRSLVPWNVLHLWMGDDRFVPRGDPDCNMGAIDRVLLPGDARRGLAPAPLDPAHVHPWPADAALAAGEGAAACAARFEATLRAELATDDAGRPVFDAILVGVGPDGHLLSIFPGSAAFDEAGWTTWAAAPTHVEPHLDRVTLTPVALDATPGLVVAAFGAGKAAIVAQLLRPRPDGPGRDERRLPALRARRSGATWVLDEAAAAGLPEDRPRRAG